MATDVILLLLLGTSRKRTGVPVGGKIARISIRGKGSLIPIVAGLTSAYLSFAGADYQRASVHRYQSKALIKIGVIITRHKHCRRRLVYRRWPRFKRFSKKHIYVTLTRQICKA